MLADIVFWAEKNLPWLGGGVILAAVMIIMAKLLRRHPEATAESSMGLSDADLNIDPLATASFVTVPVKSNTIVGQIFGMPQVVHMKPAVEVVEAGNKPYQPVTNSDEARQLLHSLQGDAPPREFSATYMIGLFMAAFFMVLLPVIYFSLTAWCAFQAYDVITMKSGNYTSDNRLLIKAVQYVAPSTCMLIIMIFMLKPFIARPCGNRYEVEITEQEQPLLFAYIRELCISLKAPFPRQIKIDCRPNASAGLRSFFSLFRRNDVLLIIGLPLISTVNLQFFSGVLAHELGHFTQGTANRINYLIYHINSWFARAVYDNDKWDEALNRLIESGGILTLAFIIAKLLIYLVKGILWVLLHLGHLACCWLLKQQEYDADRYGTYVIGSDSYRQLIQQLDDYGPVEHFTGKVLNKGIQKRLLPDNYVRLFATVYERLPHELLISNGVRSMDDREYFYSTHPSQKNRVAAVLQRNDPGIFHPHDASAEVLFRNYDELSHRTTLALYRSLLGLHANSELTTPIEQYMELHPFRFAPDRSSAPRK